MLSILHNGTEDTAGLVCWVIQALAGDSSSRECIANSAIATGMREWLKIGDDETKTAVLRVLEQMSLFGKGCKTLAACEGMREALSKLEGGHGIHDMLKDADNFSGAQAALDGLGGSSIPLLAGGVLERIPIWKVGRVHVDTDTPPCKIRTV